MNYLLEVINNLLILDVLPQHLGELELLKFYGIIDIIIILAHYIIAAMLIYLYIQRNNIIKYSWILILFSVLVLGIGTNFLIETYKLWQGINFNHNSMIINGLTGIFKIINATICVYAAKELWQNIKLDLALPSRDQLEETNQLLLSEVFQRLMTLNALKKSEIRYRAIVEDQTELICRFLADGTLTFVNSAYCRYFGQEISEVIGQNFILSIPEEEREKITNCIASLNLQNPVMTIEHSILAKNEIRIQQWTNRAIFDEKGKFIEFQAVGRDITESKQASEYIKNMNIQLEMRVNDRTAELQLSNAKLTSEIAERVKAEDALRQQAQRELLMATIAQHTYQSFNLGEILNTVVLEVRNLMQADRVLIYQFNPDGNGVFVAESYMICCTSVLGEPVTTEWWQNQPIETIQKGLIKIEDIYTVKLPNFYLDFFKKLQVRSCLVVPILTESKNDRESENLRITNNNNFTGNISMGILPKLWGLLIVQECQKPRYWQPEEIDWLEKLSTQLAIAIQQSELYHQIAQANKELDAQVKERTAQLEQTLEFTALLNRITDKIRKTLDEETILNTAVQELAEVLKVDYCFAAIYDNLNTENTNNELNYPDNLSSGQELYTTATIRYECTKTGTSALGQIIPIVLVPKVYNQLIRGESYEFCDLDNENNGNVLPQFLGRLLSPIRDDRGNLGFLGVFNRNCSILEPTLKHLVEQVANQCAIALRQARLFQASQAQVKELERLNSLKDDFLSTVSHELRTPVANIKMASQMLEISLKQETGLSLRGNKSENKPIKAARYFQVLVDECDREINLIADLLNLQRLNAGVDNLDLIPIDLYTWLCHIIEPFEERSRQHNQNLQINIDTTLPPVFTDISSLERLLTELLTNACKYTPPGENITVNATILTENLQLKVSNSGVEIPPHELPHVFDKFYRVPSTDPWKQGGTGLGLALAKKLAEHLGGNISVESKDKLITFTVELPLADMMRYFSIGNS